MSVVNPALVLRCGRCEHRPDPGSIMETQLLHFQVEHDTDDIAFDLVAVCTCNAEMTFTESKPTGGGFKDHFVCPACGNTGSIKRGQ